jgi:polysaccharide export outer membrane protein
MASVLGAALLLGGCASASVAPADAQLPPPTAEVATQPEYHIGPFDKLKVTVFGVEALSGEVQVDGAGMVSLPLIGNIVAFNKTSFELSQVIEAAYRERYIREPSVSVLVTDPRSQRIIVNGSVDSPGVFPVLGEVTLMQAIALAKGVQETANKRNIVVLRTVDGRSMAAGFDLAAIETGAVADPVIYPGDTIIVDTDRARRLVRDLSAAGGLFGVFRYF